MRRRNPLKTGHIVALAAVGAGVLWSSTPAAKDLWSSIANSSFVKGKAKATDKQPKGSLGPSGGQSAVPIAAILGPRHGGSNPVSDKKSSEQASTAADGGTGLVVLVPDAVLKAGGLEMMLEFDADKYDFPVGQAINLYGRLYFKFNGQHWPHQEGEYPIRNSTIEIVDPEVQQTVFSTTTDSDGRFSSPYQGVETVKYKLYAYSPGVLLTGMRGGQSVLVGPYRSGDLEFRPYGSSIQLASPEAQQQYHYLYQDYDAMAKAWNDYSAVVDATRPDRAAGFHDHWQKVTEAIRELEGASQPLLDARYQELRRWAAWWNDDLYNTWLGLR